MPRIQTLPPRQVGSTAEPFTAEIRRGLALEALSACTFELRRRGAATLTVGPTAGVVPMLGVALYQPQPADVTVSPGSYEYRFTCNLQSGETYVTPWIHHEIR